MATVDRYQPVFVQNFEINDRRLNLHFDNDTESADQPIVQRILDDGDNCHDMDVEEAAAAGHYVSVRC